jgi:hypothetical protein
MNLRLRGDRFDEPITLPSHRLNVARPWAPVAKNRPQAAHEDVETVLELNVAVGPHPALYFFTSEQLARSLN